MSAIGPFKVCLNVRFRVSIPLLLLFLLAGCAFSSAQIRLAERSPGRATPDASASPRITSPSLNLCVDGSSAYPCPADIRDDNTYIPAITYNYGQVLDGAAAFPNTPPDGYATITANGIVICTLYADMLQVACPADSTNFSPGTYTLILLYTNPDSDTSQAAAPVLVTVLQDTVATFTLNSSLNPAPVGTAVTFKAQALGTYNEPATGAIAFSDGSNQLGSVTLDATGTASFTTSTLALGTHTIHASYAGSIDLAAAPDAVLTQVIVLPFTATTLTSSVNPSAPGQNVTFTANVTTTTPGLHPSGAVNFNDGTKTFATKPVSAQGVAAANISTLASGTHSITANYLGDAATGPSVSPVLTQQVAYPLNEGTPGFLVTVTPSPIVLGVGLTAKMTVTVTPRSGFSGPVTLTCNDLPHESTCVFGETVIPAGGGTTTLDLSVTSPHDCNSTTPYFYGANRPGPMGLTHKGLGYGVTALAGALLLLMPKKRRWQKGLLALSAAIGMVGLSGCSSTCTDFGTQPGAYTFQVVGTAPAATSGASTSNGTPLIVQTSVGLTVKI